MNMNEALKDPNDGCGHVDIMYIMLMDIYELFRSNMDIYVTSLLVYGLCMHDLCYLAVNVCDGIQFQSAIATNNWKSPSIIPPPTKTQISLFA